MWGEGVNLHDLVSKGSCCYKKALAYLVDRWDKKMMEPKESGWSVKVYLETVGPRGNGIKEGGSDEESESEQIIKHFEDREIELAV